MESREITISDCDEFFDRPNGDRPCRCGEPSSRLVVAHSWDSRGIRLFAARSRAFCLACYREFESRLHGWRSEFGPPPVPPPAIPMGGPT
jgi:hypothetical protein